MISCALTIIINCTPIWNDHDKKILRFYQSPKGCKRVYPDAPCLKKIIKREERNYWVICNGHERMQNMSSNKTPDLCR